MRATEPTGPLLDAHGGIERWSWSKTIRARLNPIGVAMAHFVRGLALP